MLKSRQTEERGYNIAMRNILKIFFIFGAMLLTAQYCLAEDYKVLVLPDNIQFDSTNYYIYPDSSVIFASDTINEFKKDGRIKTVSMTEVRDTMRKNTKISITTKNALREFKYNYNIPFVDFKAVADSFSTDKILIISSQTDVQNYFLQRTLWNFLNIPGAVVINPAYKMSTYVALVDVKKEQVLWQNVYHHKISSMESRIIAQNFAPATEQLEKIKSYSSEFLSPDIAKTIQAKLLPSSIMILPDNKTNNIVDVSNVKVKTSASKPQKTSAVKSLFPASNSSDLKHNFSKQQKTIPANNDDYGIQINDL